MENERELEVEDEIAEVPEVAEGEEDTTDYKALALKNAGIAKRYKTKLEKSRIAQKVEKGVEKVLEKQEKTKFDYGELAYLTAMGVDKDDRDYLFGEVKSTGKELDEVMGFKYIQDELKTRKESRATAEALPTGTKRSGGATRDTVEYWLAKDELPPKDQVKLRREVVEAKLKSSPNRPNFITK